MLTTAISLVLARGQSATVPSWMDWMIAGYSFTYDEKHRPLTVFDPKTHYFLARDAERDGGILALTLGQTNEGDSSMHLMKKPLPSLTTGRGLSIGDSYARVRSLLGKPTKVAPSESIPAATTYCYVWVVGVGDEGSTYTESYSFKKDKLVRISFLRDMGGAIILKSEGTANIHTSGSPP